MCLSQIVHGNTGSCHLSQASRHPPSTFPQAPRVYRPISKGTSLPVQVPDLSGSALVDQEVCGRFPIRRDDRDLRTVHRKTVAVPQFSGVLGEATVFFPVANSRILRFIDSPIWSDSDCKRESLAPGPDCRRESFPREKPRTRIATIASNRFAEFVN